MGEVLFSLPHLQNLIKSMKATKEYSPTATSIQRHPSPVLINSSASKGAKTKLRLGAISWMAIAFPQWVGDTIEVSRAKPDGKYNPPKRPAINRLVLSQADEGLKAARQRAAPIPNADIMTTDLWLILEDMKVEPSRAML